MPYTIETFDQKSVRLRGRGGGEWTANDTLKGLMRFLPKKGLTTYRQAEKKGNKYKDWQSIRKLAYVVCRMLVTKYWTDSSLIRWRIPRESGRTGYTRPTLTVWTSLQVGFTSKDNDYSLSYFKYNFHTVFRPSIHRVRFWGFRVPFTFFLSLPCPTTPTPSYVRLLIRALFVLKENSLFFMR